MSKISIAMTTYNGSKFLLKQLTSLLLQTRQPDEVIIFDDNSTDKTVSIINQFINENNLQQRFFLFVNEQNVGYKQNFHNAIEKTTGDIVFLCDQDDIWNSNKIEEMICVLEQNPQIKVLNTSFDFIDSSDALITNESKKDGFSNHNLICGELQSNVLKEIPFDYFFANSNISPGCTLCFTKDIKEKYLELDKKLLCHDWFINLLGAAFGRLYFYNKPFIKYRIHSSNTIGLKINEEQSSFSTVQKKLEEHKEFKEKFINNDMKFSRYNELLRIASFVKGKDEYKKLEKRYEFLPQKMQKFIDLRMHFLESNCKVFDFFRLVFFYKKYYLFELSTYRGIISDGLFALHLYNFYCSIKRFL